MGARTNRATEAPFVESGMGSSSSSRCSWSSSFTTATGGYRLRRPECDTECPARARPGPKRPLPYQCGEATLQSTLGAWCPKRISNAVDRPAFGTSSRPCGRLPPTPLLGSVSASCSLCGAMGHIVPYNGRKWRDSPAWTQQLLSRSWRPHSLALASKVPTTGSLMLANLNRLGYVWCPPGQVPCGMFLAKTPCALAMRK